ncbi:uncharacterized protein LOC144142434 [Haemaphysalis longicornis]
MQPFIKLGVILSLVAMAFGATPSGLSWDLYQDTQYRPILVYECYRTGVTIEPEGTVNFTLLWDRTQNSNGKGAGTTWMAQKGTPDSYSTGTFDFTYDDQSSSILLQLNDFQEQVAELLSPFNTFAYYFQITITSQDNRVVYKIYDEDSFCGNAAALLKVADPKQTKGFTFVREVPEPTNVCVKTQLCAQ